MGKFTSYEITPEVPEIMGKLLAKFPHLFSGDFDITKIRCLLTKGNKAGKTPIKIHRVRYPFDVLDDGGYVFIFEVFYRLWKRMNPNQRSFAVLHSMRHIMNEAFDTNSSNYGKLTSHEHELFKQEVQSNGKVVDWMYDENIPDVFELEDLPKEELETENQESVSQSVSQVEEETEDSDIAEEDKDGE